LERKKFIICNKGDFTSTMALACGEKEFINACKKKSFGVSATTCLDGWRLYFAIEQVLQFKVVSVASRSILGKM